MQTFTESPECTKEAISPPETAAHESNPGPSVSSEAWEDGESELHQLIAEWSAGNKDAEARLYQGAYAHLKRIARRALQACGRYDHLATTALVNECYIKLARAAPKVENVSHFMALCARAMRQLVIDASRRSMAQKRSSAEAGMEETDLSASFFAAQPESVVSLGQFLSDLEKHDERLTRIAECRIFVGMESRELARVLGVTERTVQREWNRIRALMTVALEMD